MAKIKSELKKLDTSDRIFINLFTLATSLTAAWISSLIFVPLAAQERGRAGNGGEWFLVLAVYLLTRYIILSCFINSNKWNPDKQVKELTKGYLKRDIPDELYEKAKTEAQKKLARIIEREGDADGKRLEPQYLARLIAEHVRQVNFSNESHVDYKEKRHAANASVPVNSLIVSRRFKKSKEEFLNV